MKYTLRVKLTASFLLVSLFTVLLVGAFANSILEQQFEKYALQNLQQKNDAVVTSLKSSYTVWGGRWDVSGIENIGMNALSDGLIIRVAASDGVTLWDAMTHNSGMCAALLQRMAENMKRRNAAFSGSYTEKAYPVSVGGQTVGTVTIGYYGPYFYTDTDIAFLSALNKLLALSAAIVGIIACLLGTYMAKRLSSPITRVIKAADQIAHGNFDSRVAENSRTVEIRALTATINTLAETLGRQEALRKRLTADVAHELRTPIANLQGHLEAMIDGIWQPDQERLQSCHEETIRLSKIIRNLEILARCDSDAVVLRKERVELSALIEHTVKSFEGEIQSRHISLLTQLPPLYLEADRDKLSQILTNLLSNALKYTPEGGQVKIALTGDDRSVKICFEDTGIGISEEDLPHVFERFYRADKSRTKSTGGSGIGLAIVKSLVEAHGGSVSVESRFGTGSVFTVTLPRS